MVTYWRVRVPDSLVEVRYGFLNALVAKQSAYGYSHHVLAASVVTNTEWTWMNLLNVSMFSHMTSVATHRAATASTLQTELSSSVSILLQCHQ